MRKFGNFIIPILAKNWLIVVIFLIAAFLRLYRVEPFVTFLGDQGRDTIIIKRIVTLEHFPAIGAPSSIGQIFLGPFYYYFIAPFLWLFNFNPVGLAYGVVFWSLVGMITGYMVVLQQVNKTTAFAFLCFVTFSHILVDLSRFSWNPNLLPLFSFFTLYFFAKLLETKQYRYAIAFGSFFCLGFQLHHLGAFVVVAPAIVGLYTLVTTKEKIKLLKLYAASVGGFIFFYLPLILFDLKHQFLNTKSLINLLTGKSNITDANRSYWDSFLGTIQAFFHHVTQIDMSGYAALTIFVVLAVVAIIYRRKIVKNKFILLHVLHFFMYLILFSKLDSWRYPHYYGAIYLSFFVMMGYYVSLISKPLLQKVVLAALIGGLMVTNIPRYSFLFAEGPGPRQIDYARKLAASFKGHIDKKPFQLISEPFTETDGHVRYFLELAGDTPLAAESLDQGEELFIICYKKPCQVQDNPQWQVAVFSNKKVAESWNVENVTIYKLIHGK